MILGLLESTMPKKKIVSTQKPTQGVAFRVHIICGVLISDRAVTAIGALLMPFYLSPCILGQILLLSRSL